MPPHAGLVHPEEHNWRTSNVALINSSLDHKIKHQSAASEPAWNDGVVGTTAGVFVWRVEDFEIVPWPKERFGCFYERDSYIILDSQAVGSHAIGSQGSKAEAEAEAKAEAKAEEKQLVLSHDIFFYLGARTTADEAGTAAYKTVELDEFLHGKAVQHREVQGSLSKAFTRLFPDVNILRGGVRSGFSHVDRSTTTHAHAGGRVNTLLRIFKHPGAAAAREGVLIVEVEPSWQSLDEDDVFVLERGDRVFVWQGSKSAPMERAKAAQVVSDLTRAKHVDVEVVRQEEGRSRVVLEYLGAGEEELGGRRLKCERPVDSPQSSHEEREEKKLFRLSDESGELVFELIGEGSVERSDLYGNDIFLLDDGRKIWIWEGNRASRAERSMWLRVAQRYLAQSEDRAGLAVAKVVQGSESRDFWTALEA
ncbi:actin depolymerizing protein [Lophiostoma macrostomum CBS 122681]|uniref:Actin depolymerizing protein n=1 Tax=Lophiostoma macrostomum CBS 122681 TaxID=1314788 RepID=A0A6A6TG76_9PLEO|nr:actin depolymerizing protein [Lophiostoma macrostomum CBS 122681]